MQLRLDISCELSAAKAYPEHWKIKHIKGRLLYQVVISIIMSFFKLELLLKERICSQREQILSF